MQRIFISFTLTTIFIFNCSLIHAQNLKYSVPLHPDIPFNSTKINETTPEWAKMLYMENPNIKEVQKLAIEWEKKNPGIKTAHTRNLKHFIRHLVEEEAITAEGFIEYPKKLQNEDRFWPEKKNQLTNSNRRSRQNFTWTSVGPHNVPETQGRVNAQANVYSIDQSKSNPDIMYAGSETGYIYKTTDKALTWTCVSDDIYGGGPMEVEIHPTNPDIVYMSTRNDIYKTLDGGITWSSVRYNWNQQISTIIINPNDPDIVLAGGEEGLYRTTDGGSSWTTITTTRIYDLKFKTDDPLVVFALWNDNTDKHTDFYRSTDGGISWTLITDGWIEPNSSTANSGGRMTVSDDYPNVIYTFTGANYTHLADPKDGIKIRKSSNAGLTWQLMVESEQVFKRTGSTSTTKINRGQGYYDWDIEMVDADTNVVFLGTQNKWLTTNGFSNDTLEAWGSEVGGHSDLQEALFNGNDFWIATDGGVVKANSNLIGYEIRMEGFDATEFWSFDQGWNRDALVGTMYHNGTMGRTDTYGPGVFRFFGGAEPQFSAIKHPYPDKIISKGYGSVNGRSMPNIFNDPETSFNYNLQPNSYYAIWLTNEESEIEVCPYNYNVHWAGEGNKLMKSKDFGVNWVEKFVGRADGKISKIEIPKINPEVMYVAEYHVNGYILYKSTDGGETFNALANTPTIAGSDNDGVYISVDHTDANVLFLAFHENDNDNDKVWVTTDGGDTWININVGTDLLDGEYITDILTISGTDGDLYVTTRHAVYHRTNTQSWQAVIDGLPARLNIRHIKPYYKEGKVRIATMARGVWSLDMINTPLTYSIQPTVNNQEGLCPRDTFYFDDYSTIDHSGASWSWAFSQAPQYVSDVNSRMTKVVFGEGIDTCRVYLTITKDGFTYTDSLDRPIIINSKCNPDNFPGNSYEMLEYRDHITSLVEGPELNEWTVSFWIKPNQQENETATIFDLKDEQGARQFCANYYSTSNNLTMHYDGAGSNAWGVNPGLSITPNEWNHVAYTSSVNSGDVTIYVNGKSFIYPNVTPRPTSFYKMVIGWQDSWWGGRYYLGEIDELAIYDRVLDQNEIRLRMHITKDLSTDPGILHYYQWNHADNDIALDKINIRHLPLVANKVISTGPFADGVSSKMDITNAGLKQFSIPGVDMTFSQKGPYPNGEVVVTRLDTLPDVTASQDEGSSSYWVIHNFGSNNVFSSLADIKFKGFGTLSPSEASNPQEFELYKRDFGQHSSWGNTIEAADAITASPSNTIQYLSTGITSFGQFYITKGECESSPIVSSLADDGIGSLRAAIRNTCPGDTITFMSTLDQSDITLTSQLIDIDKDVFILGNGLSNTIIDGDNNLQLFRILGEETTVGLQELTLKNASAPLEGGALLNYGKTSFIDGLFSNNKENGSAKAFTNYGKIYFGGSNSTVEK